MRPRLLELREAAREQLDAFRADWAQRTVSAGASIDPRAAWELMLGIVRHVELESPDVVKVPAYVARVAGTDRAESAHDALSAAAAAALETGEAQVVLVTPYKAEGVRAKGSLLDKLEADYERVSGRWRDYVDPSATVTVHRQRGPDDVPDARVLPETLAQVRAQCEAWYEENIAGVIPISEDARATYSAHVRQAVVELATRKGWRKGVEEALVSRVGVAWHGNALHIVGLPEEGEPEPLLVREPGGSLEEPRGDGFVVDPDGPSSVDPGAL